MISNGSTISIPSATSKSILSIVLPNVGLYRLDGSVRLSAVWNGNAITFYFSLTLDGGLATGIDGSARLWGSDSPHSVSVLSLNAHTHLHYYNTTANTTMHLNVYNSGTSGSTALGNTSGNVILSYYQIR